MVTIVSLAGQLQSLAASSFAAPAGLLALLSLVPLLIFYLIKPEPEERVMPSMTFFMEKKQSSKTSQALNRLMRNLLLLIHVLFILGAAAALANPLLPGFERPESAVIVVDVSASMEDDFGSAVDFARGNLGEENTVVAAGENARVVSESEPPSSARATVSSLEPAATETDMVEALEVASQYDGQIVLASDLRHTVDGREASRALEELSSRRTVRVSGADSSNRWGIIEVEPGEQNSTVEVKNFANRTVQVSADHPGGTENLELGARQSEKLTFPVEPGSNRVRLDEDPVSADNTARVSVPREDSFEVTYLGQERNPYLAKAFELISFTSVSYRQTPIDGELESEIYIVGESPDLLQSTASEIERQVREEGASLVFTAGAPEDRFDTVPELGEPSNATVELDRPVRTSFRTRVRSGNVDGGSLAEPENALVRKKVGEGEVLVYNIRDRDFRFDFLYPVFWKEITEDFTGRPGVEELNRETGQTLNASSVRTPSGKKLAGEVEMEEAGIYNASGKLYAANLESEDESDDPSAGERSPSVSENRERGEARHLAAILLALLALLEVAYLWYTGEI